MFKTTADENSDSGQNSEHELEHVSQFVAHVRSSSKLACPESQAADCGSDRILATQTSTLKLSIMTRNVNFMDLKASGSGLRSRPRADVGCARDSVGPLPCLRVAPARFYSSSAVDFHANRRAFPAEDAGQLERLARALSGFLYGVSPHGPSDLRARLIGARWCRSPGVRRSGAPGIAHRSDARLAHRVSRPEGRTHRTVPRTTVGKIKTARIP